MMSENESVPATEAADHTAPHHDLRTKEAQRAADRRKKKEAAEDGVIDEWYEIQPDKNNKKGGKIVCYTRTKTGVMSQYVGRELEKPSFVKDLKKAGKFKKPE